MEEFGYLSVLLSIILGLAVAQLLTGARGCLLARSRVQGYWLTHLWAVLLLIIATQMWWSMFGLRGRHDWTFTAFASLLAQTITLFLATGLVYPDFALDHPTDLRAHYFDQRRHFFTLLILLVVLSLGSEFVLRHTLQEPRDLAFHLLFIALSLGGVFVARERFHQIVTVFTGGLLIFYIGWLFARLK